MKELPIKVDLQHGLDGAEISEVIYSLRLVGGALTTTGQQMRGILMSRLADRIERLHRVRKKELTRFLEQTYACAEYDSFLCKTAMNGKGTHDGK